MKIAIMGYSGSGKSTLANKLSEYYSCDVLHLDRLFFSQSWAKKSDNERIIEVQHFLEKDEWIIDGNFSRILYQQRIKEADKLILLNFNRFCCLHRAYKRYRVYKKMIPSGIKPECEEKFDLEFIRWMLLESHSKIQKKRYYDIVTSYPQKTVVIKNQRQLDNFLNSLQLTH